jgi:tripartite-type tricarboxylate transporter receptor subunit TctC
VPHVPTVAESGLPGFESATWYGLLAPAGTPQAVITKLHADVTATLRHPEVKAFAAKMGFEAIGNKPEEFAEVIRRDMQKWGKLIRSLPSAASPS